MINTGTPQYWRAIAALCVGAFLVFANVYLTQPLLPMLADEFQLGSLAAGMSFTITTLTLGLSLLIFGPLSDAMGRNLLMSVTLAGVVFCTFSLALVETYNQLLFLRALQGFFLAGLPAMAIAYMGDEFSKPALISAVGVYISANTLGGIGGRLIGGFFGEWFGWQEAFLCLSLISFICLVLFVLLLPASEHFSPRPLKPTYMFAAIQRHLKTPTLLLAYLIGGLNFFIFLNQYSYATFLLASPAYGLPASVLGMLFLTYLSGTLGSAFSGKFIRHIPQPLVMAMGILLVMSGSLITLFETVQMIVVGFLINAFGFFLAHSAASSWVSHSALHSKATASSVYLVFYYLGASVGGFYLEPFWQWRLWQGVVEGSFIILSLTFVCSLVLYRKSRERLVDRQSQVKITGSQFVR